MAPYTAAELNALLVEGEEILANNIQRADGRLFVMPSGTLYPAAWGWDTPQIAEGLYASQPDMALQLMEDFLAYQWPNGMVPHIVFPELARGEKFDPNAYFPPPHAWYMMNETLPDYAAASPEEFMQHPAYAFTDGKTTGIAQYPIWAINLRTMHEQSPIPAERLETLVEKIDAFHRFFHEQRDPEGLGIVAEFHPWIGCDNAPPYDKAIARLAATATADERTSVQNQRVDIQKILDVGSDASARPTDEDYVAFLKMIHGIARATQKQLHGERITSDDLPFVMYSPMLNGMLCRAENDLAALATAIGREDIAQSASNRADLLRKNMHAHLWDSEKQGFAYYDVKSGEKECVDFLGSCIPLLDEKLPASTREALQTTLHSKFADGFAYPFATVSRDNPERVEGKAGYEPCYWRSPMWMNLNTLLAPHSRTPATIRDLSLQLVLKEGMREYFNPETGQGMGTNCFGWTTACAMSWAREALKELSLADRSRQSFTQRVTEGRNDGQEPPRL
jgi:hypothetical protein